MSSEGVSSKPVMYSRLTEKKDLANLNDRLASYIDRVRSLEVDNNRLTNEAKTLNENLEKEVNNVKALYEKELNDARLLLDETSRSNAKLQIDVRRLFTENSDLKVDLKLIYDSEQNLKASLAAVQNQLADLEKNYATARDLKKMLTTEKDKLQQENSKLNEQLSYTKNVLDEEVLQRVEAENALQTLKDEFYFREQMLEQQLVEAKEKSRAVISQNDSRLSHEYEETCRRNLQEMREQYEQDLEENKLEIKRCYEEKVKMLEKQVKRGNNLLAITADEQKNMQLKIDDLEDKITKLEYEKFAAIKNVKTIEKELEKTKSEFLRDYKTQEAEMNNLIEEMSQKNREHQELMDKKNALDLEIAAYRKLLEGEEARLNLVPVESPTPIRRLKRKGSNPEGIGLSDFSFNSTSNCQITIEDASVDGAFIRLINKSDSSVSLGGWELVQSSNGLKAAYKFNKDFHLNPNTPVTIWSSDILHKLDPGSDDILMEGKRWITADNMKIRLFDTSGKEMAITEKYLPFNKKHRGDEYHSIRDDKCTIM